MSEEEPLGSFFKENKRLVKEYLETRLEIYRLQLIRFFSRFAGNLIWIIISLFFFFLLMIFLGIVLSLWLSRVTGSYIAGFGSTTAFFFLLIVIITLFRKPFFISPIIRKMIRLTHKIEKETNDPGL
jgi:hypothetical protein